MTLETEYVSLAIIVGFFALKDFKHFLGFLKIICKIPVKWTFQQRMSMLDYRIWNNLDADVDFPWNNMETVLGVVTGIVNTLIYVI